MSALIHLHGLGFIRYFTAHVLIILFMHVHPSVSPSIGQIETVRSPSTDIVCGSILCGSPTLEDCRAALDLIDADARLNDPTEWEWVHPGRDQQHFPELIRLDYQWDYTVGRASGTRYWPS